MKIVITGANGFVGSALTALAVSRGHRVTGLTRKSVAMPGVINRTLEVYQEQALIDVLKGEDVVVHLAAKAHQATSDHADVERDYYRVNLENSLVLARAAIAAGIKRFIFLSSIKVNGEQTLGVPFRASDRPNPQDIYGRSKLAAETALKQLFINSGVELVIIRPPLVWGEKNKGNLALIERLLRWRVPLPFGALANRRDLISLSNLSDFILHCTESRVPAATYLVSDGHARSTAEIVQLLASNLGIRPVIWPLPQRLLLALAGCPKLGQRMSKLVGDLELDTAATQELTGWKPHA